MMRILAIAGGDRVNDPIIEKRLLKSNFFSDNRGKIETDPEQIKRELSTLTADDISIPASNFYPLPFQRDGHYLVILFRPHFLSSGDGCKLDIVQIACEPNCVAVGYRIERGHHGDVDMHGYLHVQMTASFNAPGVPIEIPTPENLSVSYPAYPIPDKQPYASLYAALIAFAGLRKDWLGGLIREFEDCRDFYQGEDFDDTLDELKTVCQQLFLSQSDSYWRRFKAWIWQVRTKLNLAT